MGTKFYNPVSYLDDNNVVQKLYEKHSHSAYQNELRIFGFFDKNLTKLQVCSFFLLNVESKETFTFRIYFCGKNRNHLFGELL